MPGAGSVSSLQAMMRLESITADVIASTDWHIDTIPVAMHATKPNQLSEMPKCNILLF
jgi:hypothetical protein